MYDKHRVKKSQTNATNVQKKIKQIFCMGCFVMYVSTFYRPKKYGGVPKMTNIRYAVILVSQSFSGSVIASGVMLSYFASLPERKIVD